MEQKYLGITPYDEDSSFEFAGRSEETWALYDRIIRNEYTVYYAASGEGKSSLIRAGLLPILRRRDFFPVYIVFEDKELEDISSIENVIKNRIEIEIKKHNVTYEQSTWSQNRFDNEVSGLLKSNLWWQLRNYCFKRGEIELKPLFIFDQFEEVFTKANFDWTNQFFAWLEGISTDYLPDTLRGLVNSRGIEMPTQKNFKALFSFRTEYLGDLDYWCVQKHFIPSLQENRMCLKPLTPKGAKEIINLNEASLGKYSDKIIQGCAESKTNTKNEEQPCVYALILSVVCQTLSEFSDNERISLLNNLNNQQDDTIDDVLLRFYKKKLLAVGLDYNKNEKIIADIENALVDEKGKRSRRDTDETSMQPLAKWVELLCNKNNGLLKVIGKKEVDGHTVKTVEFPHDRLCKAIDSSRKERQGKISWRLTRQGEWMQFGIISTIMGIIAFLWNALMPSIKPVISNALSKTGFEDVRNLFISHYLHKTWQPSVYAGYSLDEGFSTLFLMVSLVLFIPLITICISRKNKKWQLFTAIISIFSCLSFTFLWYKNKHISFANSYVPIFTFIGFLGSMASLCVSILRLRIIYTKGSPILSVKTQYSNWPLWGGYLIFAFYVFYECLFRTTFGVNEPCDSSWALIAIPLLYTLWAWGFFRMEFQNNVKKKAMLAYLFSVILIFILCSISFIPSFNEFKQLYGFNLSIVLILIWIIISIYILWHSKSNSKYYLLSNSKRSLATTFGAILITTTFIGNLGYNPIAINPKMVCHVASWRDVLVYEGNTIVGKKLGILYSTNGKTIIPCCIPLISQSKTDSLLAKGEFPFSGKSIPIESKFVDSPFQSGLTYSNNDSSMYWNSYNHILTAYIPVAPTLEQYIHQKLEDEISINSSFKDSIDYYAAKLFTEIREGNISYVLKRKVYNCDLLKSYIILDSLQHIALDKELKKLYSLNKNDSLSIEAKEIINRAGRKDTIPRFKVLEDKHLIDFHRELSRSFLLCIIKDRASQSDMSSMFTLANTYLMAYFTSVPSMNAHLKYNGTFNLTTNIKASSQTMTQTILKNSNYDIYSDDILNGRSFAWYDLFNILCSMDMGWNSKTYKSNFKQLYGELSALNEIQKEMLPVLQNATASPKDIMKNGKNAADSLSLFTNYLGNYLKTRDSIFYESYLARLKKITPSLNSCAVDQSLKQLKDDVFSTILPVMKERETGIYNNDFENICRKLIIVSAFRGYDIQDDTEKLSDYLTEKNNLYDIVKEVGRIQGYTKQILQQKNKTEELLREVIKSLCKTNK